MPTRPSTNPVTGVFDRLRRSGTKALIPYITAGDPSLERTEQALAFFARNGADIIELGVPFSDPMADGPVIQAAMERALASGTTLPGVLDVVRRFRKRYATPVVLMGYCNPFCAYGFERFARDAAAAGVNGVLTVDLPPEEAQEFASVLEASGIIPVFLATPTTDAGRLAVLKRVARGFVYFVSVTGVTGERAAVATDIGKKTGAIRKATGLPVVIGFGISGPEAIAGMYDDADGFVVGSAIIKRWTSVHGDPGQDEEFRGYFTTLAAACHGGTGR